MTGSLLLVAAGSITRRRHVKQPRLPPALRIGHDNPSAGDNPVCVEALREKLHAAIFGAITHRAGGSRWRIGRCAIHHWVVRLHVALLPADARAALPTLREFLLCDFAWHGCLPCETYDSADTGCDGSDNRRVSCRHRRASATTVPGRTSSELRAGL